VIAQIIAARSARYFSVGAFCALTHNAVMILGDLAGAHYGPMTLVSFAITTLLGYCLHAAVTFRERLSWRAFARFAAGVATGYPISFVVMAILCSGLGLPVVIAAPVATIALFLWNYACAHWAILGNWRSC
jgi:putative flippase GtrA